MGKKNKKRDKKRSYKYAAKRPTASNKDAYKALKKHLTGGGITKKDIKKTKRKYGGIPKLKNFPRKGDAPRSSGGSMFENMLYNRIDGGTRDTMYIKGPAPGKSFKSKSKTKSKPSAPSSQSGTSSMDQQLYDFQKEREEMMAQYEQMMIQQAKEAEEQRRQMEIAMRAQAANAYSAGLQPSFQPQGAGTIPKLSGIEQFKKRVGSQFGTASPYTGLAQIKSGMVNA